MLNEDYKEMLQLLLEEQVDFMIVGAYALGTHGYPRATGDIDIWVKANNTNSRKLYRALARFGAPLGQIQVDEFSTEGIIFQRKFYDIFHVAFHAAHSNTFLKSRNTSNK